MVVSTQDRDRPRVVGFRNPDRPYGGVAHHQVDVHIFDAASADYRGRRIRRGQFETGHPKRIEGKLREMKPFMTRPDDEEEDAPY